ncbi:MAG: hypothetical protein EP146_16570 [Oscillibacter sp.]|uniref:hypothetical protein n=1 Tax=Oscillibacter sp. TaxID=1945593 RepID=UPI001329AA11|nr:hypothetical protein [Oscillibacter sp.]MUU12845.1 hypothetical protein [Oscillibacter sp.]
MAENLDTAGFSAIFISVIEMGHENTKNLKSIYKTEDFRNLNPYMPTSWDWHHYVGSLPPSGMESNFLMCDKAMLYCGIQYMSRSCS